MDVRFFNKRSLPLPDAKWYEGSFRVARPWRRFFFSPWTLFRII